MPDTPWVEKTGPAEDPRRQLGELANLYEVARALIGARDQSQVASRIVLSGMGALGLRSGALFVTDEPARLLLRWATGLDAPEPGERLALPAAARGWLLDEGAFVLRGAGPARALGALRERLVERYDAAVGVPIPGAEGLLGLLVYGPRLLGGEFSERDLALVESFASLAARALASGLPVSARDPHRRGRPARPARTLESLRVANPPLRGMVGDSPALLEACQELLSVAQTRFPVLLLGESGVGKELAARALHELSERRDGPFEVVDCGSIPAELIESELFGHVRGSFTGAHRDRRGSFELAHGGTLFLDEIGEMPLQLQTRLLRALQEGRIRRVGDERPIVVDVRVIAATHRDLRGEVTARRFREDLFYRLNVFCVRLPPLRERAGDVEAVLRHFLTLQGRELGVAEWVVDREVVDALEAHRWPGNIRELGSLTAALTLRSRDDGHITAADLDVVWRRQHGGEAPPCGAAGATPRGQLGAWVLEQARAARFNLVEAAKQLRRRSRDGHPAPITERSALGYYLTGEVLRALVEADGDVEEAARAVAGDEDLVPRVLARVRKVREVLAEGGSDPGRLRRRFGKLPAGYEELLERAGRLPEAGRAGAG